MQIVDRFSFANAGQLLRDSHPAELSDLEDAITNIDGRSCYVKVSREAGRGTLFSPIAFNHSLLQQQLYLKDWAGPERRLTIRQQFAATGSSREIRLSMDGIKNLVGLESQFGKYSFLEYDVLAKMPIYQRHGLVAVGVEIAASFRLSRDMSSGVGDFERLVTNLTHRGSREGDCPVLVLGIDLDPPDAPRTQVIAYDPNVPVQLGGQLPGPTRRAP